MAIDYRMAKIILQEHKYRPIEGVILLVGRQTVTLTPDQARDLVKEEGIDIRPDALTEIDSETYGADGRNLITDRAFFSLFSSAEMISLDVSDYEGASIVADLNQPIPERYYGCADFMFNGSCMDNLFDPASALKNMSRLLKVGGRVMHVEHGSPVQGAYIMYSPAYFFDYYAANHFADCKTYVMMFSNVLNPWHVFEWQAYHKIDGGAWCQTGHMHSDWPNLLNVVVAEKSAESTADHAPIQGFYRQVHDTEKDLYLNAFKRFSASKRPLLKLSKPFYRADCSQISGFSPLGVLEDPWMSLQLAALAELEKARYLREIGKIVPAIEAFSLAIDLCDTIGAPGLIYVERGDLYLQRKLYIDAIADYKKAITMSPEEAFLARLQVAEQRRSHST